MQLFAFVILIMFTTTIMGFFTGLVGVGWVESCV